MLRDARNAIECAYGRLKARWPILSVPLNFKLQEVPVIIITCFVLYNWWEEHNVGIDDAAVIDQIQRDREMQPSRTNERRYTFTSSEGRRSETLLKTTLVNNPPKAFCNFCACLSNSVIYSFMYSYLLYLSKLFKVKCGFDELDIFGRIGGTLAHFTYQYVQVLHLCEQSQSKTKLLFFFFTMWTLCDC